MKNRNLIESIAAETNQRPSDVAAVLEAFEATIIAQCKAGENVTLKGFGTFKAKDVKGRTYQLANHKTVVKPDRKLLKFYSHDDADEAVN